MRVNFTSQESRLKDVQKHVAAIFILWVLGSNMPGSSGKAIN